MVVHAKDFLLYAGNVSKNGVDSFPTTFSVNLLHSNFKICFCSPTERFIIGGPFVLKFYIFSICKDFNKRDYFVKERVWEFVRQAAKIAAEAVPWDFIQERVLLLPFRYSVR